MTIQQPPVVVGHDGTDASHGALHFAVTEARRDGVPLRIVHAMPLPASAFLDSPVLVEELDAERERIESELRAVATRAAGDVEVQVVTCHGTPASVLLATAEDARILVIGRERRTGLQRLIGGATAEAVAAHAASPVVVVPENWRSDRPARRRIVVALKEPAHSNELLDVAFRRAEQSGAALRVVHAWDPAHDALDAHLPDSWTPRALLVDRAEAAITGLLQPWRRAYPSVPVGVEVHPVDPRADLLEETSAADLVLMLRGTAPVLGPHLGGVLRTALHASDCPVLVVPATGEAMTPFELEREGALLR